MISLIIIAALATASILLFSPQIQRFNTYSDVARTDLMDKGWIPDFLPKDAFNIIHQHDLDTSETIVEFSFQQPFFVGADSSLQPVPKPFISQYQKDALTIGWDFPDAAHAAFYATETDEHISVIAINNSSRRALYWEALKRSSKSRH